MAPIPDDLTMSDLMDEGQYWNCLEAILARFPDLLASNFPRIPEAKLAGICALQLFVLKNWVTSELAVNLDLLESVQREPVFSELEDVENCAKLLPLLEIASKYLKASNQSSISDLVWHLRCLIVRQMVLKEPSPRIYESIVEVSKIVFDHLSQPSIATTFYGTRLTYIKFAVEACQSFLWYRDCSNSLKFLEKAVELSGFKTELVGSLGKRTLFQQKPTSLLTLEITRSLDGGETPETDGPIDIMHPKNVALNSDTLLSEPQFLAENSNKVNLHPEEQTLVLALMNTASKVGSPSDELLKEQGLTYVHYLIEKTNDWCVRFKALYLRSLLEQDTKRMERSMQQLNELMDTYDKSKDQKQPKLDLFYAVLFPPHWKIKKEFASSLMKLGCVKSALDVYQQLNTWEDIARCYQLLEKPEKAEVLIREQLEQHRTPYLLCLLGDVTRDLACYHEAWEVSNKRYARAQASLGDFYFYKKEYQRCIEHYETSLEINSLQIPVWQRLGYAALDTGDYERSAKAYRRFVQFEPDVFEVWNNLAKAYINLGDKPRAWRALQEALKCNFEEWRVWENYLVISASIGAFEDVVSSWHRLLDLKGKHQDDQVIDMLVSAACDEQYIEQHPKFSLKLQQLLGRITSSSACSATLWKCYAKLLLYNKDNPEKILNCLRKSHQAAVNENVNWEKHLSCVRTMLRHCLELCNYYKECHSMYTEKKTIESAFQAFKLNLKSVMTTVERNKSLLCSTDSEQSELVLISEQLSNFINASLSSD